MPGPFCGTVWIFGVLCSAGPRGLCGDPRIFDDLTKVPQVFRNPAGSPLLKIVPGSSHSTDRLLTPAARLVTLSNQGSCYRAATVREWLQTLSAGPLHVLIFMVRL